MRKRCDAKLEFKLKTWRIVGKEYFIDAADLQAAIANSRHPIEEIKKRMGVGYSHVEEALNGKPLDGWAAKHIEWGIDP